MGRHRFIKASGFVAELYRLLDRCILGDANLPRYAIEKASRTQKFNAGVSRFEQTGN